jgi:DUF971 family protein
VTPTDIKLRTKSRVLEVAFDDGSRFELPFEYLRVYSPSAEVRGHGRTVEPVGNYAVKLVFDDGHDTGLYTWDYLHELGTTHAEKWQQYLERLAKLGLAYPTPVPPKRRA